MLRIISTLTFCMIAFAGPGIAPAHAENAAVLTPSDEILSTLRAKGYRIVEDERTWLGRQRVIAEKNGARREVVFIPGTGEILRDYSFRVAGGDRGSEQAASVSPGNPGPGDVAISADPAGNPGLSVGESLGTGRTGEPP